MTRRLRLLAAVMCGLAGWMVLQLAARRVLTADELRYVPPGYVSLAATGTIRATWSGMEQHFGGTLREDAEPGPISGELRGLHALLKKRELEIRSPSDLARFGLDLDRGVLAVQYTGKARLIVVPMAAPGPSDAPPSQAGKTASLETLVAAVAKQTETPAAAAAIGPLTVTRIGDVFITRPSPTIALVSNDADLLRLSVLGTTSNLEHARGSDVLYQGIKSLRGRLLAGSSTLYVVPSLPAPLRRAWAVLRFEQDAIDVSGLLELRSAPWRVLSQFFAPTPGLSSWADRLSGDAAAAVVLEDAAIADYIRFFGAFADLQDALSNRYGGVLADLQHVGNLRRVAAVATGYRDGLPELMLGVWGDSAGLEQLVEHVRTRLRRQRDVFLMSQAMEASGSIPSPIGPLKNGGFLEAETAAMLAGYTIQPNAAIAPALDRTVFEDAGYSKAYRGATIRYLTPPLVADDFRYRPELKVLLDLPAGEQDRYRLGVTVVDGVYWFATDVRDLEWLVDAGNGSALTLTGQPQFIAASSAWRRDDRLQMFINMDRTLRAGLLSPQSAIHERVRNWLWELRDHPAVSLTVASEEATNRVRIRLRLTPRKALLQ